MALLGTSAGWSPPCKHGHCTAPRESKAARIEVPWPVFPFGGTFKPAGEAEGIRKHVQQHKLYDLGKQCKCLSTYTLMSGAFKNGLSCPPVQSNLSCSVIAGTYIIASSCLQARLEIISVQYGTRSSPSALPPPRRGQASDARPVPRCAGDLWAMRGTSEGGIEGQEHEAGSR